MERTFHLMLELLFYATGVVYHIVALVLLTTKRKERQ